MSKNAVILLIYHRHKLLNLIYYLLINSYAYLLLRIQSGFKVVAKTDVNLISLSLSLWLYSSLSLGTFLSFLILYRVYRTPWTGDQPLTRPLPRRRITQNKLRHRCLEWDSNPQFQCSRGRRHDALDLAATVIGWYLRRGPNFSLTHSYPKFLIPVCGLDKIQCTFCWERARLNTRIVFCLLICALFWQNSDYRESCRYIIHGHRCEVSCMWNFVMFALTPADCLRCVWVYIDCLALVLVSGDRD
jgi:hypothetical protein